MKKDVVEAIIEIPFRSRNKYEVDHDTKRIKLDRVLYSAMGYPAEYGFLENSLALDGDPLDILVLSSYPTFPGCVVPARVLGYLKVIDNGYNDEKVIAVVDKDPRFDNINTLDDLTEHQKAEIKDFFQNYKTLQNITVETKDFYPLEDTIKLIEKTKDTYKKTDNLN